METGFDFIVQVLNTYPIEYIHLSNKHMVIRAIKLLNGTQTVLEPEILYIGYSSEIIKILPVQGTSSIICIGNLPGKYLEASRLNLIAISGDADIFCVFNQVQEALLKENQFNQWYHKLIKSLTPEHGIKDIIKTGYEMLGNPIYIADLSSNTIAMINNKDINDDTVWNEFLTKGYLSYDLHEFYKNNNQFMISKNRNSTYYWQDTYSKHRKIIGKITVDNKQVGIMAVIEYEKAFCDNDLRLVSLLCDAVSVELQKNSTVHYLDGEIYKSILKDLLSGKINDREEVEEKRKFLKVPLDPYLHVMTIDINRFSDRSYNSLLSWSRKIESLVVNSKSVVYDGYITMMVQYDKAGDFFIKDFNILKQFFEAEKMKCGISRCFYSIEDLRKHYIQSVYALKRGKLLHDKMNTFFYEDYAIFHIVEACLSDGNLKKHCHPSLLALIEYDKQNNTSFEQTLATYIYNSGNVANTANDLHVHRNTVLYRIEKISEIMNVDLTNNNIILQLHFSFKIIEYEKSNTEHSSPFIIY